MKDIKQQMKMCPICDNDQLDGKKDKNLYYIQEAAYNSLLMNKYARSYRNCDGACRRCGASLDRGGFKPTESGHIHIGCGGSVKVRSIPSKKPSRNLVLKSRVTAN